MAIEITKLISMSIEKLKNLQNLDLINFDEKNITAIFAPNGSGKSTVLHALACCFNHKNSEAFSRYFLPTTHATWKGSLFTLKCEAREGDRVFTLDQEYSKQVDRWAPRYEKRPSRYIDFLEIRTCVPHIEAETQRTRIHLESQESEKPTFAKVRKHAGDILNRDYSDYKIGKSTSGKYYPIVNSKNVKYNSLSMGAGEQRVFRILESLISAHNNALILIDEIDLLLHKDSLDRLLFFSKEIAEQKNLQIIFTSHRESILEYQDFINIRHLLQTPNKTFCLNQTTPDAIKRLTGTQTRPLQMFCEDSLSQAILERILSEEGLKKYVLIRKYGAAYNCFVLSSGMVLNQESIENTLFVLDGDVYRTEEDKLKYINATLTGTEARRVEERALLSSHIKQFNIPFSVKLEKNIFDKILEVESFDGEETEIREIAKSINYAADQHDYLDQIVETLGDSVDVGLSKIVRVASKSPHWAEMTSEVRGWVKASYEKFRELPAV